MIPIIWIILGVTLLGFYNSFILLDFSLPETDPKYLKLKKEWHLLGAALFLYITAWSAYIWGIKYAPYSLSLFWLLFAGIVSKIGLKQPFFFVGTTAATDILIRKIFPKNPQIFSAILKIGFFIGSILLILLIKK